MITMCYSIDVTLTYKDNRNEYIGMVYDNGGFRYTSGNSLLWGMAKSLPKINDFLTLLGLSDKPSNMPADLNDYNFRFSAITTNGKIHVVGTNESLDMPISDDLTAVVNDLKSNDEFNAEFRNIDYLFYSVNNGNWHNKDNWYSKLEFVGERFNSDIDEELSVKANSIPNAGDDAIIYSAVYEAIGVPEVKNLLITDSNIQNEINFGIEIKVTEMATVEGQNVYVYNSDFPYDYSTGPMSYPPAIYKGKIIGNVNLVGGQLYGDDSDFILAIGNVYLSQNTYYGTTGTIFSATILGNVEGNGLLSVSTVNGDILLNGQSNCNSSTVNGNASLLGQSVCYTSTINGDAAFFGSSSNNNTTINGNAVFNGDSTNNGGTINGNAVFNDNSSNLGIVNGNITCNTTGTCIPS